MDYLWTTILGMTLKRMKMKRRKSKINSKRNLRQLPKQGHMTYSTNTDLLKPTINLFHLFHHRKNKVMTKRRKKKRIRRS
jgi:hypothetical protein